MSWQKTAVTAHTKTDDLIQICGYLLRHCQTHLLCAYKKAVKKIFTTTHLINNNIKL